MADSATKNVIPLDVGRAVDTIQHGVRPRINALVESDSAHLVGAGLQSNAHRGPSALPELGVDCVHLHVYFLHHVG